MVKINRKAILAAVLFAAVIMAAPVLCSAQTLINRAGATFPYPIYSKWFSEYRKLHGDVRINYQSIGSGGGIGQVTEGTVDFEATDGPMNTINCRSSKRNVVRARSTFLRCLEQSLLPITFLE